jgi:hypothetical protein
MKEVLKEKKSLWVVIISIIVLIGLSVSILYISESTKPDLNSEVEIINAEYLSIWNGTDRVLWRSGVINSTSDAGESIVFWVNASQFADLRFVRFLYQNGTNGEHYNSSESIDNHNSWNYLQWWTDYTFFIPEDFNNTDPTFVRGYSIPKQLGNTNVTLQVSLALWNGTGLEFQDYNATYSVSFSDYEVWFAQEVHMTTGIYYSIACILLIFCVGIITFLLFKKTEVTQPQTMQSPYTPDVSFFVERSNHLEGINNNLRTGASILLTLGASSTIWIQNITQTLQSSLQLGFIALAFCAFFAIVFTFTSTKVESNGFKLGPSLVPSGQTSSLYIKQLKDVIREKQKIIGRIQFLIGIGLLYLVTFALAGILLGMMPNAWAIIQEPMTMIPLWTVLFLILIDSGLLSYLVFGPKGMKLFSFSED